MAESFSGWYQNHGSYATDADFGGDPATYKSTSGYICILECEHANYVLDWFSRKQTAVSRSTTEAELCAAGHGATKGIWERLLLTELKMIQPCKSPSLSQYKPILNQPKHLLKGATTRVDYAMWQYNFVRDLYGVGWSNSNGSDITHQIAQNVDLQSRRCGKSLYWDSIIQRCLA